MASVEDILANGDIVGYDPSAAGEAGLFIVLYSGILVVSMHLGFAMLEAGSVRKGSAVNILFKNLGTLAIGAIAYYTFGRGLSFGQEDLIGTGPFFYSDVGFLDYSGHAAWFFAFSFVATAATIVSGAVAGRIRLPAYFIMAFWITAFVYPPITGSIWLTDGWLSAFQSSVSEVNGTFTGELVMQRVVNGTYEVCGMYDYAGSGVVHLTGGVAAFWGALIVGPRAGRFDTPDEFVPHNYALTTMGTLILWFGWYGFNCGSALGWYDGNIGKVAVTTTLAPCFACVTGFVFTRAVEKKWDLAIALNCILGGLVSITSGCPTIPNGLSAVAGIIGAFVMIGASKLMKLIKIDDPVDAIAVHGFCGIWGCIATGFFASEDLIFRYYAGNVCTGGPAAILPYQIVGVLYIIAWTSVLVAPGFVVLRLLGVLRVAEEEQGSLDVSEHGISAYEAIDEK